MLIFSHVRVKITKRDKITNLKIKEVLNLS